MASRFQDQLSHLADATYEKALADVHVGFPARVTRYDASLQVVDVEPLIADWFAAEGDDIEQVFAPILTNVPVVFPGAGGFRITFPVAVGDVVEVLIQDRSIDAWQDQGGKQAPADRRRHDLSDAVAIPGLHDNKHPWTGAALDGMTLGKDGGQQVKVTASEVQLGASASQAAICGDALKTYLDALVSALQTFSSGLNPSTLAAQAAACNTALGALTALSVYRSATVKVAP